MSVTRYRKGALSVPILYTAEVDNPNGTLYLKQSGSTVLSLSSSAMLSSKDIRLAATKVLEDSEGNTLLDPDDSGGITTLANVASATTFNSVAVEAPPMVGVANAKWYPCVYLFDGSGNGDLPATGPYRLTNPANADWYPIYLVPLSTNLGGYKLNIVGLRFDITDADANNKVNRRVIIGLAGGTETDLDTNHDDLTTVDLHSDETMDLDVSAYQQVIVEPWCDCANAGTLDIASVEVKAYYDT